MSKQELFEQIAEQFAILEENNAGTTKASQARARKAAGEIKKLIPLIRRDKISIELEQGIRFAAGLIQRTDTVNMLLKCFL